MRAAALLVLLGLALELRLALLLAAPRSSTICRARAAPPVRRAAVRLLADQVPAAGAGPRVGGPSGRRTMRIDFTCRACDSRTSRMINPEAFARGVCIVQCANTKCAKHHIIADNIDFLERGFKNVIEWGKANGVPGILMEGAEQLARHEILIEDMVDSKADGA
ncbi:DNL zinc finger-domain-containing protein [Pavlovales sp. CCMP2436]|nr:DNL zinc finger-domain-containing protein [Pavlovales sp. CCMP2436]|mmetsp:Transcript_2986/g.7295  ORF Transcript_2986/g.7295 Transcript_2986/m.7295 type:complete len:164 (+) Transcript_2986:57-548(+)|eukprot:CAMPEP_0179950856 /NCGR_PEP_ID=MMETSP0983-20121128/23199_1 /TAXON_ID=483367 /ORGANISM="non described non described, Strain CCMP 2436" /LENGTH=163 /DNA_ID=CAMNT_0021860905 /DNA_START=58 /DNA_END=549 /DNA_ORIENTATION=+